MKSENLHRLRGIQEYLLKGQLLCFLYHLVQGENAMDSGVRVMVKMHHVFETATNSNSNDNYVFSCYSLLENEYTFL